MSSSRAQAPIDRRTLSRFCVVGALGFLIDSGATAALIGLAVWGPMVGRLVAFLLAATVTWQLNRRFTFRSNARASSWLPYVAVTSVGAIVNLGVYRVWISWAGTSPAQIVAGIAAGSLVALAINFAASRKVLS